MLKRKIYQTLLTWKANHQRECLLIKGARQIGKTFIIDYFGRNHYASYLYLNFIDNPSYAKIFEESLEANDLFKTLTLYFPQFKLIAGETLLFLDEIQACPRARTAFKALAIDGRVDVIASGSLLGINFLDDDATRNEERRNASIPVGYERQLMMTSLDFEEYLWAKGYQEATIDELRQAFILRTPLPTAQNDKLHALFREYMVIGGMPDVVNRFLETNSFSEAYEVQCKILNSNLDDIARYATTMEKPKIRDCYLSLPQQLARENKKFKYAAVAHGGSARKFGGSVDWLCESSLVIKCTNLTEAHLPLSVYKQNDMFKLYLADVGILCAMMGFEIKRAIVDNTLTGFAKGGLYENVIASHLYRKGYPPYYYMPKSNLGELDFLIEQEGKIVPIEVKSGNNTSKTFDRTLERADIALGYKFTDGNIGQVGKKVTLPHYMVIFI